MAPAPPSFDWSILRSSCQSTDINWTKSLLWERICPSHMVFYNQLSIVENHYIVIRAGPAFVFLLCRGHRLTCRYRSLHICIHLQSCAYKRIMRMFANIPLNKCLTNKTTINTSAQIDRESRWTRHSEISDQCIHIYIYYIVQYYFYATLWCLSLCLITSSWYIYIHCIYVYIIHILYIYTCCYVYVLCIDI